MLKPARLQLRLFSDRVLFRPFEKLNGMARHDGRNGVLVDKLRVSVAPQKDAKIIEPGHDTLQLHPVHQEYGQRGLILADVIEESVLQIL